MNRILQLYYKPEQLPGLVFEPYPNLPTPDTRYLFMESRVIAEAFALKGMHHGYRFSGVLSPGYREKLSRLSGGKDALSNFMRTHTDPSPEKLNAFLDKSDADVVSLVRTVPHDLVVTAGRFHPNFGRTLGALLTMMGISLENYHCRDSVYFNYFLGREDFMTGFAAFMQTAIDVMESDYELKLLLATNSMYQKPFPLKEQFGIDYWPLHPFIAERLISIYIKLNSPKVEYFL